MFTTLHTAYCVPHNAHWIPMVVIILYGFYGFVCWRLGRLPASFVRVYYFGFHLKGLLIIMSELTILSFPYCCLKERIIKTICLGGVYGEYLGFYYNLQADGVFCVLSTPILLFFPVLFTTSRIIRVRNMHIELQSLFSSSLSINL